MKTHFKNKSYLNKNINKFRSDLIEIVAEIIFRGWLPDEITGYRLFILIMYQFANNKPSNNIYKDDPKIENENQLNNILEFVCQYVNIKIAI